MAKEDPPTGPDNRLAYGLPIILAGALVAITSTAWLKTAPDLSNVYSAVGTGLVGLTINPQNRAFQKLWAVLIWVSMAACVAIGVAMFVVPAKNPGAAFAAALTALAALFVDGQKLVPASKPKHRPKAGPVV
ncbi:MAG TPA: hypothetical protein VH333_05220 [Pseudonocardiaceae bacterium]|jgi:hypothetical protein|nr:hypothetical protein [Pseudonocardiaceae bacterium]